MEQDLGRWPLAIADQNPKPQEDTALGEPQPKGVKSGPGMLLLPGTASAVEIRWEAAPDSNSGSDITADALKMQDIQLSKSNPGIRLGEAAAPPNKACAQ